MNNLTPRLEALRDRLASDHALEQVRELLSSKDQMMWRGPLVLAHKSGFDAATARMLKELGEVKMHLDKIAAYADLCPRAKERLEKVFAILEKLGVK